MTGELLMSKLGFLLDAGLRSDRLKTPEGLANYAKAVAIIAKNRGCVAYLEKALDDLLLTGRVYVPTALELCDDAARLMAADRHTTSVPVIGADHEPCIAIMEVNASEWRELPQVERESRISEWACAKGFTLAPKALPSGNVSDVALETLKGLGISKEDSE